MTDAAGRSVTEIRDPLGRVIAVHDNIDHGVAKPGHVRVVETLRHPEPGLVEVTDAWGATSSTRQDVFGRVTSAKAPNGTMQVTTYDDVANTVSTGRTPTGALSDAETVTTEHLDQSGRPKLRTGVRADGMAVPERRGTYDGLGRAVSLTDGLRDTSMTYDAHGNPSTTVVGPAAGGTAPDTSPTAPITATRTFDGHGNSLEKVLSSGDVSSSGGSRTLDARGRTASDRDRLGRSTTYEYTIDGLLERTADPSGRQTRLEYDPVTRHTIAVNVTSTNGDEVATSFEHDPVTGATTAVWDPRDPDGTRIEYEQNAFGLPTRTTYPDGQELAQTYDAHGRLTTSTDISGAVTRYRYTPAGLLAEAAQTHGDRPATRVGYTYDDDGRVVRLDRGNGGRTTFTFTSLGQVASETTVHADGRHTERTYTYLPTGNLHTRTDARSDTRADERTTSTTTEYTYDAYDRLTRSRVLDDSSTADTPVTTTDYEPTLDGDLARETVTTYGEHAQTVTRDFAYSVLGELTDIATTTLRPDAPPETVHVDQVFDAAGQLIRDPDGTSYEYDPTGRLTTRTAPDGTTTTTGYWADGTRRDHTSTDPRTGRTTRTGYYWNGSTLVNERRTTDDEEPRTAGYLLGAARHARTTAHDTLYYDTDRHGNVTETTDQHGGLIAAYTYTDYGTATVTAGEQGTGIARNPFQYSGEFTDEDGTQPLGTRTYHPAILQFSTPDTEPLHNLRAYADLNPIMNADPTGTTARPDQILNWVMLGVGLVAFALSAVALSGVAPVTGPAIAGFAAAVIGMGADAANIGTAVAQLIHTYQPDWFSADDAARLQSEELTYAGYALAAVAAPGLLSAALTRTAARVTESLAHARNARYVNTELKNFAGTAEQAGRRVTATKGGAEKHYYHATKDLGAKGIKKNGFDPARSTAGTYGNGTYTARYIQWTERYGWNVFEVTPDITRAMKVDAFGDGSSAPLRYKLRNPLWTKTSPKHVSRYVREFANVQAVDAYATEQNIQAVFIGSDFTARHGLVGFLHGPKEKVLKYLRIPAAQVRSVAPLNRTRLLTEEERADLWKLGPVDPILSKH